MCGIVYVNRKDKKPAAKSVMKRYREQAARGQQGFGYIAIKDGQVVSFKRAQYEHEIDKLIRQETASEILFHHRFPTSTPNVEESAHPLFIAHPKVLDHQYFIVHNGVISNADDLKEAHEKLGFEYRTECTSFTKTKSGKQYETGSDFNDSEALGIEIALAMDGYKKHIGSRGAAAVIGIKMDSAGKVLQRFVLRNDGNPLKYHSDDVMTAITSTGVGTLIASDNVKLLHPHGEIEEDPVGVLTPLWYVTKYPTETHYNWAHSSPPEDVPPRLPAKAGFGAAEEDDFDYREPTDADLGLPAELPKAIGDIIATRNIGGVDKFKLRFKELSTDGMWNVYQNLTTQQDDVKAEIEELDELITNAMGSAFDHIYDNRADAQARFDRLTQYIEAAETMLTEREALVGRAHDNLTKAASLLS